VGATPSPAGEGRGEELPSSSLMNEIQSEWVIEATAAKRVSHFAAEI
jgi:hypothetical protein